MNNLVKKFGLGIALGATALSAAAPVQAQHWRGRYHRGYHHGGGGDVAAGALLGGIVGLGIGAAIAGSRNDRAYDRGYYPRGYSRDYYAPPPRVIERDYYYNNYPTYAPRCFDQWHFDPYHGERVRVRVCE